MKKIAILFGAIMISTTVSMAYMQENETSNIDSLRAQGFSRSTLEVVDKVSDMNKGKNTVYERRFVTKKHHNKLGKIYTEIKNYVDPSQDNGKFGEQPITFTNTWQGFDTKYSSEKDEIKPVENL